MNSFESKRDEGENDSYISKLIRQDLIAEFVAHVNQANISLSETIISPSIFETNSILLDKEPTLIEYAAFFWIDSNILIFGNKQCQNDAFIVAVCNSFQQCRTDLFS